MAMPISPKLCGSTKHCAATAGITRLRSKIPNRYGTTDADSTFRQMACENPGARREIKKGRNNEVSALFHASWQVVAGRLPTLSVVPDLVTRSVTPPPE